MIYKMIFFNISNYIIILFFINVIYIFYIDSYIGVVSHFYILKILLKNMNVYK